MKRPVGSRCERLDASQSITLSKAAVIQQACWVVARVLLGCVAMHFFSEVNWYTFSLVAPFLKNK